jgi:hypothetical protein
MTRLDSAGHNVPPKFRYKRVGGWFDGLARGQVGQERWSTVLTMLLDGVRTNAASPFPGFGPETTEEIESRMESDNTVELDALWPLAPCSIIVTMSGEWYAHPQPDHLDERATSTYDHDKEEETWRQVKLGLFQQNRGALAVAWDLSWDFIAPMRLQAPRSRMPRAWGTKPPAPVIAGASSDMDRASKQAHPEEDGEALARWAGEGGAPSRSASGPVSLRGDSGSSDLKVGLEAARVDE